MNHMACIKGENKKGENRVRIKRLPSLFLLLRESLDNSRCQILSDFLSDFKVAPVSFCTLAK